MTTFNKTITNSVNLLGPQATNKWNAITWGVDSWAYGKFDLQTTFTKVITNSVGSTSAQLLSYIFVKSISNSLPITGDMVEEFLIDQNGYYKVFGNGTNAEQRPATSYNRTSENSVSYTSPVKPNTSYTQIH